MSVCVLVDAAADAVDITSTDIGRDLLLLLAALQAIEESEDAVMDAVLDRAEEIGAHDAEVRGSCLLLRCCDLEAEAVSGDALRRSW